VPAPPGSAGGGFFRGPRARVYRIAAPEAEFVISFAIEPERDQLPIRLSGRIEAVEFGANTTVTGLVEDEEKGTRLNRILASAVLATVRSKLQGQPINVPLSAVRLPGFALASVSPLDPSGWIRVILNRTGGPLSRRRPAPGHRGGDRSGQGARFC
jgi:hypothetical protein